MESCFEHQVSNLFAIMGTLNRKSCKVLIDCGATSNFLSRTFAIRHDLISAQKAGTIILADGRHTTQPSWISTRCRLKMGQYAANFCFTVTDLVNGFDVILGMPWLEALQPSITWKTKILVLNWRGQELAVRGQKLQKTGAATEPWAAPLLIQLVSERFIFRDACQEGSEALLFVVREKGRLMHLQDKDPALTALK